MFAQEPFGFLNVCEGQLAGAHKMRHHRLDFAVEPRQELVGHMAMGLLARQCSLENVRVADPLDDAQRALRLEPVDRCLDGGVSGPLTLEDVSEAEAALKKIRKGRTR